MTTDKGGKEEEKRWMRKRRAGSGVGEVDKNRGRRAPGFPYCFFDSCNMFIIICFTVSSIL